MVALRGITSIYKAAILMLIGMYFSGVRRQREEKLEKNLITLVILPRLRSYLEMFYSKTKLLDVRTIIELFFLPFFFRVDVRACAMFSISYSRVLVSSDV